MVDITTFNDFNGTNQGGLIDIWVIPENRVTRPFPSASYGVISSNFTLTGIYTMIPVHFIPGTGKHDEPMIGEQGGHSFESVVSFQLGKNRPETRLFLEELINNELLVVVRDANSQMKIIGSAEGKPARLRLATPTTGALPADKNHIAFELVCNDTEQAYYYTGTLP